MNAHRVNAVVTSFFGQGAISLLPEELKKRSLKRGLLPINFYTNQVPP